MAWKVRSSFCLSDLEEIVGANKKFRTPITGDKRKAEAISDDDSIKSDYDGRINRKNHLKRPRLQDDKQQGEQRILPLK